LFSSEDKSEKTHYCDVDLIILKENRIKVIFEIEESNHRPTQICGKFLTSALSSCYIYRNERPIYMDDSVLFIQIIDTSKIKDEKSLNVSKWKNIERSIQNRIPLTGSKINRYKLFYGNVTEYKKNKKKQEEITDYIKNILV